MSHQHTFLFTDLEGSTRLWEEHPQKMLAAMSQHDALLKNAVEEQNGHIVKTTGDGLHAVFESPVNGLQAALAGQISILKANWPEETGPFRVRMGLHAGEGEERDGDYYGPALNRAARIMSAAHGGQVLVSELVSVSTRESLPDGASLRDLGEHALRDLLLPERLYQLCHAELEDDFPPIRSLSAYKHNLPVQLTSFVGRETEVEQIKTHLKSTRLLTLLGPGGTGKTRLSMQAAAEVIESFPDGVWFIELASLTDPDLLAGQVALTLRVQDQAGRTTEQALRDYLRLKELLLIFDNVEHMVRESAELVETLLRSCPKVKIMVTGREALFIGGETTIQIPSLSLPKKNGSINLEEISACESVKLFLERARAALPGFQLSISNGQAVAEIALRLDGIPLALELAAARLRMMSVEQIAARLSDRFRLLTGGQRTALPRQQTLQALIDWSWNLLEEDEKTLFRRLSVFAGGWTLEAAEAVAGYDGLDVFFAMEQLVNKSLILVDRSQNGAVRYRRLESIRQYGRDRLFESGEGETVRAQHAAYYLDFAEEAGPELQGPNSPEWFRHLQLELENLRAAVEWSLENRPGTALRITALLLERENFWIPAKEAENWLRTVIERTRNLVDQEDSGAHRQDFASAMTGLGMTLVRQGLTSATVDVMEEAIRIAQLEGESQTLAWAVAVKFMAGIMNITPAHVDELSEAIEYSQRNGYDRELVTLNVIMGGYFIYLANDHARGLPFIARAIEIANRIKGPQILAIVAEIQGVLKLLAGEVDEAILFLKEARQQFQYYGDHTRANGSLSRIGHLYRRNGKLDAAEEIYRETLPIWQEMVIHTAVAHQLECFAFLAIAKGRQDRAARLLGASNGLRERVGEPRKLPEEVAEYAGAEEQLKAMFNEAELAARMAEGANLDMDSAIAYALEL